MRVHTIKGIRFRKNEAWKIAPPDAFVEVPEDEARRLIEDGSAEPATEGNKTVMVEKPKAKAKAEAKAPKGKPEKVES